MSRLIYIIRHGDLDAKYAPLLLGHSDVPLSPEGRENMAKLKRKLPNFDGAEIYSSPLLRCRESAEILELRPIFDDDLREFFFGDWELRTVDDALKAFPELAGGFQNVTGKFRFPGGESGAEFHRRAMRVKKMAEESDAETIVLITHGGVISQLICAFLNLDSSNFFRFRADRASLSIIRLENGEAHLDLLNYKG